MLSGCPPLYQNKLQEKGVQDIVNRKKIKFESYGNLVDQTFSQFNENSINNQDENYETPWAEYLNENDSENTETNKTSTISNFLSQILSGDETAKGINFLNSKRLQCGSYIG